MPQFVYLYLSVVLIIVCLFFKASNLWRHTLFISLCVWRRILPKRRLLFGVQSLHGWCLQQFHWSVHHGRGLLTWTRWLPVLSEQWVWGYWENIEWLGTLIFESPVSLKITHGSIWLYMFLCRACRPSVRFERQTHIIGQKSGFIQLLSSKPAFFFNKGQWHLQISLGLDFHATWFVVGKNLW